MKKKTTKIFLILSFVLLSNPISYCFDNIEQKLNKIETNYFGYNYNDSTKNRLNRIESALYGKTQNLSDQKRIEKIYSDLNIIEDIPNQEVITQQSQQIYQDIGPQAEAGIKYPIVDKLEEKVFSKTYKNEDIYQRLSRLEKQIYKKESTSSLNERVDALRNEILGGDKLASQKSQTIEEILLNNEDIYNKTNPNENSNFNYYSYENSKNTIPSYESQPLEQNYDLDILEKQLLGKRYASESSSQRLARLENQVFQRTFTDNDEARIQRLLAVMTAQKSSQEYDSNKWARRLNTGVQIGSILLMVLAMIL